MPGLDGALLQREKKIISEKYGTQAKVQQLGCFSVGIFVLWVFLRGTDFASLFETLVLDSIFLIACGAFLFMLFKALMNQDLFSTLLPLLINTFSPGRTAAGSSSKHHTNSSSPNTTHVHNDMKPKENAMKPKESNESGQTVPRGNRMSAYHQPHNKKDLDRIIFGTDHHASHAGGANDSDHYHHTGFFDAHRNGSAGGNGMRVMYENNARNSVNRDVTTQTEMMQLGIRDVEDSMMRVREWISAQLQDIAHQITTCDKFFYNQNYPSFDCTHNLSENYNVGGSTSTSGGGFGSSGGSSSGGGFGSKSGFGSNTGGGGGFGAKPNGGGFGGGGFGKSSSSSPSGGLSGSSNQITKLQCLQNEKAKLAQQAKNPENLDLADQIERRIQLEFLLDVTKTFPTGNATIAEMNRRQSYIIRRIKTLASQRTLNGYNHCGGDNEVWCEEYPTDAHLLIHIISQTHLTKHIRLAHQTTSSAQRQDLAIIVGNNGEPFFYVKYRSQSMDRVFFTKPGRDSLFHAILIFAAVIKKYHGGAYGTVFNLISLEQSKLESVVAEWKIEREEREKEKREAEERKRRERERRERERK